LLAGIGAWSFAGSVGSEARSQERAKRRAAKDSAQAEHDRLIAQLKNEAGPEGFQAKRAELAKARQQFELLEKAELLEFEKLKLGAHDRHKHQYLDRYFIDRANIPGVGTNRKAALRSFGIETAADVNRGSVILGHRCRHS
jgi:DNA-binding helix-hairpin-helix protein with protein kinase domain